MTHVGYLLAGWGVVAVTISIYSWLLVQRGKRLAARVPEARQRWMSSDDDAHLGES